MFATGTLAVPATAAARGDASVAALQVGLRQSGRYDGPVDGIAGPATSAAVRTLQRGAGLAVDGVIGPQTRLALGAYGRFDLGNRVLKEGLSGWDVAGFQFLLAWHGFPSGPFDGAFGARTEAALMKFQKWADLEPDGRAGAAVLSILRREPPTSPLRLASPMLVVPDDPFGPRGDRFHTGIDFAAPAGTSVAAAGAGEVVYAGWLDGGWGYLVTIAHGSGVRTMYAHLSGIDVSLGERVTTGTAIGRVGATGHATGPHLHFEVRLRGAAIDPATAIDF
jgi:peptidoglycan hydrolase-like protein with peptidoglycan-binding domain